MNEALGPFIGGLMRTPNGDVMSKHDPSIVSTKNVERVMNVSEYLIKGYSILDTRVR